MGNALLSFTQARPKLWKNTLFLFCGLLLILCLGDSLTANALPGEMKVAPTSPFSHVSHLLLHPDSPVYQSWKNFRTSASLIIVDLPAEFTSGSVCYVLDHSRPLHHTKELSAWIISVCHRMVFQQILQNLLL